MNQIKKENHIQNWVMIFAWTFAIIFFWGIERFLTQGEAYRHTKNAYLVFVVVLSIYWLITGLWTYQNLDGELKGYIEFKADSFVINNELFRMENIIALDILNNDYYGRQLRGVGVDFSPCLSQGVSNYIKFTDKNEFSRKVFFKLTTKNQYKELSSFIMTWLRAGKIPSSRIAQVHGM